MKTPIGCSNNNPLNIRFSPMNQWKGQIGCRKGFCVFDTKVHGYRAALVLLHNYVKRGYDTVHEIISRWAPASENDTKNYIRVVVEHFNGYADPCYKSLTADTKLPKDNLEALLPYLFELAWIMSLVECGLVHKDCDLRNILWDAWSTSTSEYYEKLVG